MALATGIEDVEVMVGREEEAAGGRNGQGVRHVASQGGAEQHRRQAPTAKAMPAALSWKATEERLWQRRTQAYCEATSAARSPQTAQLEVLPKAYTTKCCNVGSSCSQLCSVEGHGPSVHLLLACYTESRNMRRWYLQRM